jgi:hypothetical protein
MGARNAELPPLFEEMLVFGGGQNAAFSLKA